jgi:Methylamine utilisation protein MauE
MLVLDPVAAKTISLGAALLFGSAALHKLRAPREFAATLAAYELIPRALVNTAASLLFTAESMVAVGLMRPSFVRAASLLGAVLLLAYAISIAINLMRGRRDLDCGCSALGGRRPVAPWMVARNLIVAVAMLLLLAPNATRALTAIDLLTIGACLVTGTMLYLSIDLLLGQIAPRAARWNSSR